jgi:hypothetical protein
MNLGTKEEKINDIGMIGSSLRDIIETMKLKIFLKNKKENKITSKEKRKYIIKKKIDIEILITMRKLMCTKTDKQ